MAAKANPPCDTNKVRYLISESDGSSYYEAVCADKKGIVILADPSFKMVSSMSCAKAVGIGGGCKLSDTAGAATELAQAYSDTLKAAGVNCTVGKFSALPPKLGATDAVEVECGANPGAVVVVRDGKTTVFDCARAMPEGYGCGMAPKDSVNSALTAQLNAKGHVGCVVNGSRPLASANWAYMEVSCTDGEPGFMIRYPRTSNNVDDVFTCAKATAVAGGCQLPTNKKS